MDDKGGMYGLMVRGRGNSGGTVWLMGEYCLEFWWWMVPTGACESMLW